jgi:cytochrome c553
MAYGHLVMNDRNWIAMHRRGSVIAVMPRVRRFNDVSSVLLGVVTVAFVVNGGSPAAGASPARPSNLQVLSKDSTAAEVRDLMEKYAAELGVACEYCHTRNPTTQRLDYVSDDNPAKHTARVMIAMLNEINTKYLAQLDDQKYAVLVSCGNCHRGQTDPPEFEPAPRTAGDFNSRRE